MGPDRRGPLLAAGASLPLVWPPPTHRHPLYRRLRRAWDRLGRPPWLAELLIRTSLPRYVIGALGLVWDSEARILLVRQSYREPGWALPGGGVRPGETLEACLIREMAEELGWEIEVGPAVGIIGGTYPYLPLGIANVGFVCHWRAGVFRPSAEVREILYLPLDQAVQRVAPGIRPLLEMAASQRRRQARPPSPRHGCQR
jgi:8-oxo-dGTP pyrophosphatase MutT (NUDIX family)